MASKGFYRNSSGYYDPTAGAAMSQVMKEYKQARREQWQKDTEVKSRPKAYVVSQYAGDVKGNTLAVINCCRHLIRQKKIPIASHLLYPRMLKDDSQEERYLGTMFGLALLALCEEVWVFTRDGVISEGMKTEIAEAKRLKKPIRYQEI